MSETDSCRHFESPANRLDSIVKDILYPCYEFPELRDEMYFQMIKQVSGVGLDHVVVRYWQLMVVLCGFLQKKNFFDLFFRCIAPSAFMEPYITNFMKQQFSTADTRIAKISLFASRRLAKTLKMAQHPRSEAPSTKELDLVYSCSNMSIQLEIGLLDGNKVPILVDHTTMTDQIHTQIMQILRLNKEKSRVFNLYEVYDNVPSVRLKMDQYLFDVLRRLENVYGPKFNLHEKLIFRKDYYLENRDRLGEDAELGLIFGEALNSVLTGRILLTHETFINMAGLQLQALYGDYTPNGYQISEYDFYLSRKNFLTLFLGRTCQKRCLPPL